MCDFESLTCITHCQQINVFIFVLVASQTKFLIILHLVCQLLRRVNIYRKFLLCWAQGAFFVDGAVSTSVLEALDRLFDALPPGGKKVHGANERRNFTDTAGWVVGAVEAALRTAAHGESFVFPQLRFLDYTAGGGLPAHVDLARTEGSTKSTLTFCLYLNDVEGGETALLRRHTDINPVAKCAPVRGRLFAFPHICPHMALPARTGKRLLRGDCTIHGWPRASGG